MRFTIHPRSNQISRMRSLMLCLLAFCLMSLSSNDSGDKARHKYPKGIFVSPVKIPLYLSGTFGELRSNHFHSGIDIKTQGTEGHDIVAVADGYVSRIKIGAGGFGHALYINHQNGYQSVYAHLQRFNAEIGAYVKNAQYNAESFEIELFPEAGQFQYAQGELIAYSGNSGSSGGPHLHFEIRDAATAKPINPLLFGFNVEDTRHPLISGLGVYDQEGFHYDQEATKYKVIAKGNGRYKLANDTVEVESYHPKFILRTYDKLNGANNMNGVYRISGTIDGASFYEFNTHTFAFDETRYLNAHIDYREKKKNKSNYNQCFHLPGNALSMYDRTQGSGWVDLFDHQTKKVEFVVEDVAGNTSTLQFYIKRIPVDNENLETISCQQFLDRNVDNQFEYDGFRISLPAGSLYDNICFRYEQSDLKAGNIFSKVHSVCNPYIPVHRYFNVYLKPNEKLKEEYKSKAIVVYKNERGGLSNKGGTWEGDWLKGRAREFGQYFVSIDTIKPKVTPINIYSGKNIGKQSTIAMRISDNLSGISSYRATVDDEWILMDYDRKRSRLTYTMDDRFPYGKHAFKLLVLDDVGNKTEYKAELTR